MGAFKFAKTVMKSLFNKPATLMYPVVEREWQERTRGAVGIDEETCILCGICARKCPTGAIAVDRKSGTWEIKRMQCIQCGYCVAECPKGSLVMEQKYTEPQAEKVVDTFDIQSSKPDKNDSKPSPAADAKLACNKEECVFCGLCAKACPAEALKVDRKEKIWEVDAGLCVKCEACVDKCPKNCLSFGSEEAVPEAAEAACEDGEDVKTDKREEAGEKTLPKLDADKCIYCRACENECPQEAISAEVDEWTLDEEKCIGCGACADVCPAEALKM